MASTSSEISLKPRTAVKRPLKLQDADFFCPVCLHVMKNPYIVSCGHSFCKECLEQISKNGGPCPTCNCGISALSCVPNKMLARLIEKHEQEKSLEKGLGERKDVLEVLKALPTLDSSSLSTMMKLLERKKRELDRNDELAHFRILREFFTLIQQEKLESLKRLQFELKLVENDVELVDNILHKERDVQHRLVPHHGLMNGIEDDDDGDDDGDDDEARVQSQSNNNNNVDDDEGVVVGSGSGIGGNQQQPQQQLPQAKHHLLQHKGYFRLNKHLSQLKEYYFSLRNRSNEFDRIDDARRKREVLQQFGDVLYKVSTYSQLKPVATIHFNVHPTPGVSGIVTSVEFNRNSEFFAATGVTRKIKIYDYEQIVSNPQMPAVPVATMTDDYKVSYLSWNPSHQGLLATSNYAGIVRIWDAFRAESTIQFEEHRKRCWSVHFCNADSRLLASASDDGRVKIWDLNVEQSVVTLEPRDKANVCCVQFMPGSKYYVAFGSADHSVYIYDLRKPNRAHAILKGHNKAVAYTKFINDHELVSSSTDGLLKLWSREPDGGWTCTRNFSGHINEKNFVGLTCNSEFIATGSEDNKVYVYHRELKSPVLTYEFLTKVGILEDEPIEKEVGDFVSSICWREDSDVLLAANSRGDVHILEMAAD